jgi:hypothetical protein
MSQQAVRISGETQHNRACDACRQHKVRCLPDNSSTSQICQRCAKTDRHCVFTAAQKRKQRKRTDTRVAELEREVQAMRALFEGQKNETAEKGSAHITARAAPQDSPSNTKSSLPTARTSLSWIGFPNDPPEAAFSTLLPPTGDHSTANPVIP